MSIAWRKVWRDLAHNKLRTLLAVLSTAVGVFALGLVFGMSGVMRDRMTKDHQATVPAHINFWGESFDQDTVESVLQDPDVAAAELEIYGIPFRWKLEGETVWRDGSLFARDDYDAQHINLVDLRDGDWPAGGALAVERQTAQHFDISLGTAILVESGQGERRSLVEGIIRAPLAFPPQFGGDAAFYATPEIIIWLTGREISSEGFNQLHIRLESFSREKASETAKRIEDRLERMGLSVNGRGITDPDVHWMQERVDTLFFILAILGVLSLGLSTFLIVNTMNAIFVQQVWQIGVMKVVGATSGRVMRIYLMTALIYGLFASLLAVPLAAVGAHLVAGWLLGFLSIDSGPFGVSPVAVIIQVAVGLVVPVLAVLAPVIGSARISPHQAISNYGLGAGFGHGRLDNLIGRIRFLSRPLALSLRNTFRRKARVALTLLTLILSGVIFIMVMSVGNSLNNTVEVMINDFGFDVQVRFNDPYPVEQLVEVTESVPGVTRAEVWGLDVAILSLINGEEHTIYLRGVPPDSAIYSPRIVSGRGLLPGDDRAIVLNNKIAVEKGLQVGDEIELTIDEGGSVWTIVGLMLNTYNGSRECLVPFGTVARETGNVDHGRRVAVLAEQHDAEDQQALIGGLRDAYAAHSIEVSWSISADEFREQNRTPFNMLTCLMLSMAVLSAIVGSLGLMGAMSINVVERGREIGVMRAIGATSFAIARIFVGEGVLLGVLSWLLAVPLSYPGSRLFSNLVGDTLMELPLDFSYSTSGMLLWLLVVVVFSALASLWPALRATKVSVREALAYE